MRNEITRMNWHRRLFGALIATLFLLAPSTVVWADNHGGGNPPPPPPGDNQGPPAVPGQGDSGTQAVPGQGDSGSIL